MSEIAGTVRAGFEPVRAAFRENFARRGEVGAACCVYRHGETLVDLWGGVCNRATGAPWQEDTMVLVFSATKGLAAMTLALAHSRGWLDYDARVADYWPEFAQRGKDAITVRQLLAHQAGLFAFDAPIDRAIVAEPDRLAAFLARQAPAWKPGAQQAYHAFSIGFYESELLRRVDPLHRSLGRFFHDEIAAPLDLDFYIRLPEAMPNDRLAAVAAPPLSERLFGLPPRITLACLNPRSPLHRALIKPARGLMAQDKARIYAREFEVPAGGGVGTARAMARAYGVFAAGGSELRLRAETLAALAAPPIPAERGFRDACMLCDLRYSLGFFKPSPVLPFGPPSAFGAPGAGGAFGFADPEAGLGYAYVTNRMGTSLSGDPRDVALRAALHSALR